MRVGRWPILYEHLIDLKQFTSVPSAFLNVKKKMNQAASLFFFSDLTIDLLALNFPDQANGLKLYLCYGSYLWRAYMDRTIQMKERLYLAGCVISFLLIWYNDLKEVKEHECLLITRNTMTASLQSCFALYILNYLFTSTKIPV